MRTLVIAIVVCHSALALAQRESSTQFPSADEVRDLLKHTQAVVSVFATVVIQQKELLKRDYGDDEKLIARTDELVPKLHGNPDAFNSAAGYLLTQELVEIVQSETTCSTESLLRANTLLAEGRLKEATAFIKLSADCSTAAILAKTVYDAADDLYLRAALSNDELRKRAVEAATECADALKMCRR
jgi:hypothetical protein